MDCGSGSEKEKAALRQRAESFGSLLVQIQEMTEMEAKLALEEFMEPSITRAARIDQYYREFSATSKKFRIVSQSVTDIKVSSDRANARVVYRTIAQSPEGAKIPVEQVTRWKKVGDTWYRTIGEAQKKLDL